MKILFISIKHYNSFEGHGIYSDLIRKFSNDGHSVYVLCPSEENKMKSEKVISNSIVFGYIPIKRNKGSKNIFKKGIEIVLVERLFIKHYKHFFKNERFDLILYATPPVTFQKVVEYAKKRSGATAYLMLKDIFPQNAVDIGLLKNHGLGRILVSYFRKKEKRLYSISDYIGCMSKANLDYIIANNPELSAGKVEVLPNCIEVVDKRIDTSRKMILRKRHNLPEDKIIYVYGGNLGKPQGISFMLQAIKASKILDNVLFLIIGDGSEYEAVKNATVNEQNVILFNRMPKDDYEEIMSCCDFGLVFLDYRFSIPNFPSRILSYMQSGLPIVACTDESTDIGHVLEEGGFGWFCPSNSISAFIETLKKTNCIDYDAASHNSFRYLIDHFDVSYASRIIYKRLMENRSK